MLITALIVSRCVFGQSKRKGTDHNPTRNWVMSIPVYKSDLRSHGSCLASSATRQVFRYPANLPRFVPCPDYDQDKGEILK